MSDNTGTRDGCAKWLADTLLLVVLLLAIALFIGAGGLAVIAPLPGA